VLYLTPASIGYLTQSILALAITGYLSYLARQAWRREQKPVQTLLLTGSFGMATCLILLFFLDVSLRSDLRLPALYLQNIVAGLCLLLIVQFAYYFPSLAPGQKREAQILLGLSLLYVAWEVRFALHRFARLAAGHVLYRPSESDYPLAVGFLWLLILFLRQTVRASTGDHGGDWLRALWRPRGSEAQAARAFALVAASSLWMSIVEVLYSVTPLPTNVRQLLFSLGMMFILFTFALVYFNYLPQTTTFMVKLVGTVLATSLAAWGALGWFMFPIHRNVSQQDCIIPNQRTLRFTPNDRGGYDVAEAAFHYQNEMGINLNLLDSDERKLPLPFSFPFYGQTWDEIYVSDDGMVSFGGLPDEIDARYYYTPVPAIFALFVDLDPEHVESGGVFVQQTRDRMTITWHQVPLYRAPEHRFTFQLTLYPGGVYDVTHNDLANQTGRLYNSRRTAWIVGATPGTLTTAPHWLLSAADLSFSSPDQGAVVEDYYLRLRRRFHQQLSPLAALILGNSLLIVVGFPLFFQRNLVKPLDALLASIRQVEAGNLTIRIPVRYRDEIGSLTQSFNRMVSQLHTLMMQLEARVAERTQQLEQAKEAAEEAKLEAEAASRAKSSFIENISHELRTPLASVLVYIETLLDGNPGPLTEIQREFLEISYDNAKLLSHLIDDLLDVSHSAREKLVLQIENVELTELSSALVQTVRPLAEEKGIQMTLNLPGDAPLFLEADRQRLKQIINNLLSNGIKFTPQGGHVTLTLRTTPEGHVLNGRRLSTQGVHLRVSDTGEGVPLADLPHVFERFYRGENVAKQPIEGAGLGLYLARELVEVHHGVIWAENQVDEGALFHVWLPTRQPE
jgi:signal transduction histidine kinase